MWTIGHRGARGLEPENTLRSFRKAIEIGVDYVEGDVHLSRDGHPVVIHDPTLNRTTNGRGRVKDFTLEELKHLDAGKGEKIPHLEEVLLLVKGKAKIIVEIKEPRALEPALKAIDKQGMKDSSVLTSFHAGVLKNVPPGFTRAILSFRDIPLTLFLAEKVSAKIVGLKYTIVDGRTRERVEKAGRKLLVWTVNEEKDMARMMELKVDYIASDFPDRLIKLVRNRLIFEEGQGWNIHHSL